MGLTYNRKEQEIVVCKQFRLAAEANLVQAYLKEEGINCFIENDIFANIYPGPYGANVDNARLMVHARDLDRALQIIDSLNLEQE